ncbi:MAG: YebC/PmpR family DNA-binding transcriptional regulator [Dehalococcoidia bacterium]|nr:YebC/PmpR family DNA-binding transcriptional regulator [Dehalococcoidia bacterium]
MSLHSHWSQIKRQKGANDAKRAQLFTKLIREITVAARDGGANVDFNPRLRLAVQRAKDATMTNEVIDRALKKVVGGDTGNDLVEIQYEGYGPGGTAILVVALTDNRNRTSNEVKSMFSHQGGNIGEVGSVNWIFDRKGVLVLEGEQSDLEIYGLTAIDSGAEDVTLLDGAMEMYAAPQDLEKLRESLSEAGAKVVSAEISMMPKTTVELDEKLAIQNVRLLEKLDDLDDVQQVHSNATFPEAVLQEAS